MRGGPARSVKTLVATASALAAMPAAASARPAQDPALSVQFINLGA